VVTKSICTFAPPKRNRQRERAGKYVQIDILNKEYRSLNVRESSGSPEKDNYRRSLTRLVNKINSK